MYPKMNTGQRISCILQVIHAMLLLKKGGYSHNDLHDNNIMVNKTTLETFTFQHQNVPFHGYQISVIDYGEAWHKDYHTQAFYNDFGDHRLFFLSNPENYFFHEFVSVIYPLVFNFDEIMDACKKRKRKLPWDKNPDYTEDGCKLILKYYLEFFHASAKKYGRIYPKAERGIKHLGHRVKPSLTDIETRHKNAVLYLIATEFLVKYPRMYLDYFKCCSKKLKGAPTYIPEDMALNFLRCQTVTDIVNTFCEKIKINQQ